MVTMAVAGIAQEAKRRGIKRLCHFTRLESFLSILSTRAVMSNDRMTELGVEYQANDKIRLDRCPNHICCTIQYPNVFLLERWRHNQDADWLVISLDPSPIWQDGTLFSPRNAALHNGKHIRSGLDGFNRMFRHRPDLDYQTRSPRQLDGVATDLQAEVLVRESVIASTIRSAVVPDRRSAQKLQSAITKSGFDRQIARITICEPLFKPSRLLSMVEQGERPEALATVYN